MAVVVAADPPRSAAATAIIAAPVTMEIAAAYACSHPRRRGLSSATCVANEAPGVSEVLSLVVTVQTLRHRRLARAVGGDRSSEQDRSPPAPGDMLLA